MRVLLAGWFSFSHVNCTAGDILARDLVRGWLTARGIVHDVASPPPFEDGVDYFSVAPEKYSHVVFLCGPFGRAEVEHDFLGRFRESRHIGLNLSFLPPLAESPFDVLIERDSDRISRPDLVFGARSRRVPVVGLALVHRQDEYGSAGAHDEVHSRIHEMLERTPAAVVKIDTLSRGNAAGLRSPAEIESLLAKMDMVITTRLHGTVLSLKNGVPVLAVDPVRGGGKVVRQCRAVGWENVLMPEECDLERLQVAFQYCLGEESRVAARKCAELGRKAAGEVQEMLFLALKSIEDVAHSSIGEAMWTQHPTYIANRLSTLIDLSVPKRETAGIIDDGYLLSDLRTRADVRPLGAWTRGEWGPPADDSGAIELLQAAVDEGIRYLIVTCNARWWLEHYPQFTAYLRERSTVLHSCGITTIFRLKDDV